MDGDRSLVLPVHRRRLATDALGRLHWQAEVSTVVVPASRAAVVLCDVWDRHWCRGANERLRLLLPRMQLLV
jgi:hypothetical protein